MASNPPFIPRAGKGPHAGDRRFKRSRRRELAVWWREIDRVLLFLVLTLMGIGTLAVAAGSPATARRLSTASVKLDDLHFFYLHLRWQFVGLIAMIAASMMERDKARRFAIVLGGAMLVGLMLVPVIGSSVNGAKRWLNLGFSLQPSEFLKPAFAVILAWILSWRARDPNLPVVGITGALMGLIAVLLMAQPDFGSTVLFGAVWFAMVLLAGISVRRIAIAGVAAIGVVIAAYLFYANARHRIDAFIGGGTAYDQVDLAERTLLAGGWTGSGLWLGVRKLSLPEAHTDYVFSVVGEEFGLLVCALIVVLYMAIVIRVMLRLVEEENLFTVLAASGLTAQLGGQAFINILVNLQLFPSKGMTLPLISYGGSSTIALCLGIGLLLAITRRNPFIQRSPFGRALPELPR
ncbi:FtsW/RodA/SpoVE family cell cycle protein [Parablastomonas sp. CN1-191]|uniref:FtsW/RodA/SpoVE family cell cycle protein n=1 Tax=Parablastomonas sp. CN1-191 TaxID=3400908 RepID=UPI003BF8378F